MQVKDIIRNCAVLLDDTKLLNDIDTEELSAQSQKIVNTLMECLNSVNRKIATVYFPLKNKKVLFSNNLSFSLSSITNEEIVEITQVLINGYESDFEVIDSQLFTKTAGQLTITYTYMPKTISYGENINYYNNGLSANIFAYAVVSEYLYIMGNVTEAKLWDEKFKESILDCSRHRKEIIMPSRGWY